MFTKISFLLLIHPQQLQRNWYVSERKGFYYQYVRNQVVHLILSFIDVGKTDW